MAKPYASSYMDPEILTTSTNLYQVKEFNDSLSSSPQQIDPSQTKIINPIKNPKQESKTDYSGDPKVLGGFTNQCSVSAVYTSHLTQWKKLDLSRHGLTTFPEDLSRCDKLEELNLSNNPLGPLFKFPKSLQVWDSLKKLDLSGCGLTTFPEDVWGCDELEELNLSNNPLGPSFIFPVGLLFCFLKKLDLSGCGLTMLYEGFWFFCKLEEFNLSNNPLSPSFEFSNWFQFRDSLKKLDLSGCGLTTFPEGLRWCYKLEKFNLSNNPLGFSFKFPKWLQVRNSLKKLDLSGGGLTTFPEDVWGCDKLEELNLSNNPLGPSFKFPEWLQFRNSLKKLDLSGCGLTTFPVDRWWCDKLEELNLSNNPLGPSFIFPKKRLFFSLEKLDLSGCGLKEWPCALENYSSLQELNLSNNFIGHEDLLNSGKMFISHLRSYKSGKRLLQPKMARIIFEDTVYTQSNGVWTVEAREDVAIVPNESSMKDVHKWEMRLKDSSRYNSEVSSPNEEIWLDEFRGIRKSEKLTIETYHSMLQSLNIVHNLVSNNVEICQRESTLNRLCCEIRQDLNNITFSKDNPASGNVEESISYLKSAVDWLKNWSIQADDDQYKLQQSMTTCGMAFKGAYVFVLSSIADNILATKLKIMSKILSNLTKPEAAVVCCLQSLQELHDLQAIRVMFSSLDRKEAKTNILEQDASFAKSVLKINKILFEFVRVFFKSPPTVEEWPATINTMDEQIYNPLIDGRWLDERLMDASMAVSGKMDLDTGEVDDKGPITDVAGYSVPIIESNGQTNNSITIDQKGGCFNLSVASAFLLFPPQAVEEQVTLTFSRVRHKDCEVKPRNGDVFVSRILKIEPEGVTFRKPVTVLLSHSLYEDQGFLYFYELIVENLTLYGCQDLKSERISKFEDIPKEISSNKEIFDDYLPFAKATIHETCTLVVATRVRSDQILIPTNRSYVFSKQYGDIAELKITFPAGVTEEILNLTLQLYPAATVLNKDVRVDKTLVYAPIIRISGQTTSFLKAVEVELTYSHSDIVNIEEEFLPVGNTIQFTTDFGLLMRSQEETKSITKCLNLNESNDVYIKRPRKDQLRFSCSVEHFCNVFTVVKTSANSHLPPTNAGMVNTDNPDCHRAIVLAVHDTSSSPKTLYSVLAPKEALNDVKAKWNVVDEIRLFQGPLQSNEPIYCCVPLSDGNHLPLDDHTLRFDPDPKIESILDNNTDDNVDLRKKHMRFLKDRMCNNGENHLTQNDCRAKAPIHIAETRSVQASAESPEVVFGRESPQGHNASSGEEGAEMNNGVNQVMMHRCELFQDTIETAAKTKLKINKAFAKDPKGGKATEIADVAGPTTTVFACLACGIIAAVGLPTFGAASFAGALVAGTTLAVKVVDKHFKQANAKEVENVVETAIDKAKMSSVLNCIVKDVAKELSCIFESQLFELKTDKEVKILAECAVDLMLDLRKNDTFDRDTLLRKVLKDGNMKKKDLLTKNEDVKWSAPDVFRKPGLRRMIFGWHGAEFKYFVKPEQKDCKTSKYGYRGQFLQKKEHGNRKKEGENVPHEDPGKNLWEDCPFNHENCTNGYYFGESDIDSEYTVSQDELCVYRPLHVLIQCPKILVWFMQQENRPSLANFLKNKLPVRLSDYYLVYPVYRPHSPLKVPNLQKSDFTGSDFSHSDFTDSCLEECDFTRCVMLFANLARATMCRSKFCKTLISHSDLEKVDASSSIWIETSILYSRVNRMDIRNMKNCGDITWKGTNNDKAIMEDNPTDFNEINHSTEVPTKAQPTAQHKHTCHNRFVRIIILLCSVFAMVFALYFVCT